MVDTICNKDLEMKEYLKECERKMNSYEAYKKRVEETGKVEINNQEDIIHEKVRQVSLEIDRVGLDSFLKKLIV